MFKLDKNNSELINNIKTQELKKINYTKISFRSKNCYELLFNYYHKALYI